MELLREYVKEYRKQLEKGVLQMAYRGLMEYIMDLRTQMAKKYPDLTPGSIYPGYMDMTYFPLFPKALKGRKLKIAVVFIHETMKFEVWLVGYNKQIQSEYWKMFKESGWNNYRIPEKIKGVDSILEYTIADKPDFNDTDSLTRQIEERTLKFINDIEYFLSK